MTADVGKQHSSESVPTNSQLRERLSEVQLFFSRMKSFSVTFCALIKCHYSILGHEPFHPQRKKKMSFVLSSCSNYEFRLMHFDYESEAL